jgi:hypothetical protein
MYVNQIDELIDNTLNKFYLILKKENFIKKILEDVNFVKYQNLILKFIQTFVNTISKKEIFAIVKNESYVDLIINIIKRYCAFYIYIGISYHYTGSHSLFITNLIESSKYMKDSTIQISDFFNSENNSKIIKFYYDIKNFIFLFEFKTIDKIKILLMNNPLKYDSTIKIFNDLGEDYVANNFLIKENFHNIIKTLIFRYIYINEEKNEIIKLLNQKEKDNAEYKYIEVIVSNENKLVNFNNIMKLLTLPELRKGYAEDIYDYLHEYENIKDIIIKESQDFINYLFSHKILIPITEDFLRFHKDTERYEQSNIQLNKDSNNYRKDRESTKIKFIINKMNNIINYYSPIIESNPKLKLETTSLFYKQLEERKVVLYNDDEEVRIIQKLDLSKDINDYDLALDLKNIRKYVYVNFKNFSKNGIKIRTPNTINCIRYINLLSNKLSNIETRIGNDSIDMNVIGVAYNPANLILETLDYKDLIDVRKLTKEENGFIAFQKILKKDSKLYYWLFNNKDEPKVDKYVDININDPTNNIKVMLEQLYHTYINIQKDKFIEHIDKLNEVTFVDLDRLFKLYNIKELGYKTMNELFETIIETKIKEYKIIEDDIDSIIPGKNDKLIKLPVLKDRKNDKTIIKVGYKEIDVSLELSNKIIPICNHYIKWTNINKLYKSRVNNFSQLIFDFTQQYVKINSNNEYICKSCNEMLYLQKYVQEGTYIDDQFLTTSLIVTEKFEDNPKYSKFLRIIRNLEKNIEKVAITINLLSYIGNDATTKLRRKIIIKDIIDLILVHTEWLKTQPKNRIEEFNKKYNTNMTNLFFFELKDDIFLTSSNDTDYYKIIKYNNIIAYLVFILITDMNFGQIISLKEDKKYNYFIYSKIGKTLFSGLYLRINQTQKIPIIDIPILSYILYYISGILINNRIWLWNNNIKKHRDDKTTRTDEDKTNDEKPDKTKKELEDEMRRNMINVQKNIIHTIIDLMNTICEVNFNVNKNYLYAILTARFFTDKLNNTYNDKNLLKKIEELSMKHINIDSSTNKITFIIRKTHLIDINSSYDINDTNKKHRCELKINKVIKKFNDESNNKINLLSNCPDGKFHKWSYKNGDLICSLCNQSYNSLVKLLETTTPQNNGEESYLDKLKLLNLKKLAHKYCITGEHHDFIDDKCIKCGAYYYLSYKCKNEQNKCDLSNKELLLLEKNLMNKTYEESIENINKLKSENDRKKNKEEEINSVISKFMKDYQDMTKGKINNYIDDFIDRITKLLGHKIKSIYIKDTIYKIDHDYLGNMLKDPIIILQSDDKIHVTTNHRIFNKDVLYYKNKANNVYVYYDVITLQYLGYSFDDRILKKTSNIRSLNISLSIRDMIYFLGFNNKYLNLYHINKAYQTILPNKVTTNDIIEIIRDRSNNLKQIISRSQSIIYNIINRKIIKANSSEKDLINEFINKIKKININDIFKNTNHIMNKLKIQPVPDNFNLNIIRNYVDINKISNLNNIDNHLLFYIIYNFNNILDLNNNNDICYLIVRIIYHLFNTYYISYSDYNVQRFDILLFTETPFIDKTLKPSGYYQELLTKEELGDPERIETTKESAYDEEQAKESLDIDDYDVDDDIDGVGEMMDGGFEE